MSDYDNTNAGVLFKNDKGDNEKRPDYTGTIDVDGVEYKLAGWAREGKKGRFLSLKLTPKEERRPSDSRRPPVDDDLDF